MPIPGFTPHAAPANGDPTHDDHGGLARDLEAMLLRRRSLRWLVGMGALGSLGVSACGGGSDSSTTSSSSSTSTSTTTSAGSSSTLNTSTSTSSTDTSNTSNTSSIACSRTPTETEGPYPGDGSNSANGNTVNALMISGIVRSDIRSSVGGVTGTAEGVPLTLTLTLENLNGSCAALEGYAIYVWHCTREGEYSLYASSLRTQNYLRGVQITDSSGKATFQTIFPGCYSGRMPHIHFEVYRSESTAMSYTNKLLTSQIAFPVAPCNAVYAASAYSASAKNFASMSYATDGVFRDNYTDGTLATETCAVTGDVSSGYVATLTIGLSA